MSLLVNQVLPVIGSLPRYNQTNDGGYIIGGKSSSGISGDKSEASLGMSDYWVVKLDSLGIIQWQNTIGGSGDEYLKVVIQTNDNAYILGGDTDSPISGDKTDINFGLEDYCLNGFF